MTGIDVDQIPQSARSAVNVTMCPPCGQHSHASPNSCLRRHGPAVVATHKGPLQRSQSSLVPPAIMPQSTDFDFSKLKYTTPYDKIKAVGAPDVPQRILDGLKKVRASSSY